MMYKKYIRPYLHMSLFLKKFISISMGLNTLVVYEEVEDGDES